MVSTKTKQARADEKQYEKPKGTFGGEHLFAAREVSPCAPTAHEVIVATLSGGIRTQAPRLTNVVVCTFDFFREALGCAVDILRKI